MKSETHFRWHSVALIMLLLISTAIWTGCDDGDSNEPSQPSGGGEQPSQPEEALPDLVISGIEVFPAQPQAGQNFTLNVYVRNAGQAPSSQFSLAISIEDISRGATYPVGTFNASGLQPGEDVPVYTSTDRRVNDPGSYQVHVEIQPFSTDGNTQNNMQSWAFTVN